MDDHHTADDRTGNHNDHKEHDEMADHHETDQGDELENSRTEQSLLETEAEDTGAAVQVEHEMGDHQEGEHDHGDAHGDHGGMHEGHEQMFRRRFFVCLALSIPVLLYSETLQGWLGFSVPAFPGSEWINPVFAIIVFAYGGIPFLRMVVPELRDRAPGMMTLISMAISVAFVYSLASVVLPTTSAFFWELVTLIDIMLLGHWIEMRSVRRASYRRDNAFGIAMTLLIGSFVMIVSAITLSEGEMTLTGPGEPLAGILGSGAVVVFMLAVFLASITSATGTLFGAGFIVPQSLGKHTEFGDRGFRRTVIALIGLSAATALPLLVYTGFGPVEMATIMPAVNGLIGLPVTVFALIGAVNRFYDIEWYENAGFLAAGLVLLGGSLLTAQSLYDTIISIL